MAGSVTDSCVSTTFEGAGCSELLADVLDKDWVTVVSDSFGFVPLSGSFSLSSGCEDGAFS